MMTIMELNEILGVVANSGIKLTYIHMPEECFASINGEICAGPLSNVISRGLKISEFTKNRIDSLMELIQCEFKFIICVSSKNGTSIRVAHNEYDKLSILEEDYFDY